MNKISRYNIEIKSKCKLDNHFTIFVLMKSIFPHIAAVLLFSFYATTSYSQYNWDIGVKAGTSNYLGDIGGKDKSRRNFVLDLKFKSTSFVVGGFVRYKFNDRWSLNNSISFGQIKGDDALSTNKPRVWRNLRFKNNIIELSTRGEFNFFVEPDLGGRGRYNKEFKSYVHAGLTCFYHNPKGSLDGNSWQALRPLQTEGVSYKKFGIGVPIGIGGVFTFNKNHRIGFDFSWTSTFTDYLDDISTVYNEPNNMSDLGASLANQSNGIVPENQSLNFVAGEKRGDPSHDDSYIFTTVSYSYFLQSRNKYYKKSRSKFRGNKRGRSNRRRVRAKF